MAEKHLDLLQFAAGGAAQLRCCTTTIVRRNTSDTSGRRVWPKQLPHDLLGEYVAPQLVATIHRSENISIDHAG